MGDKLTLQVYSEDHMTLAVACIRDQMTKVLFPVVEGLAGESESHLTSGGLTFRNTVKLSRTSGLQGVCSHCEGEAL